MKGHILPRFRTLLTCVALLAGCSSGGGGMGEIPAQDGGIEAQPAATDVALPTDVQTTLPDLGGTASDTLDSAPETLNSPADARAYETMSPWPDAVPDLLDSGSDTPASAGSIPDAKVMDAMPGDAVLATPAMLEASPTSIAFGMGTRRQLFVTNVGGTATHKLVFQISGTGSTFISTQSVTGSSLKECAADIILLPGEKCTVWLNRSGGSTIELDALLWMYDSDGASVKIPLTL